MSVFPIKPLPRWTVLPGDPAPLRRLLAKAAQEAPAPEPPDEQEHPKYMEAS